MCQHAAQGVASSDTSTLVRIAVRGGVDHGCLLPTHLPLQLGALRVSHASLLRREAPAYPDPPARPDTQRDTGRAGGIVV